MYSKNFCFKMKSSWLEEEDDEGALTNHAFIKDPDPDPNNHTLLSETFKLEDKLDKDVSHWWKTSTLISLFFTGVGGLVTSISVGSLIDAFKGRCILYAKVSLRIDSEGNIISLSNDKMDNSSYDCSFCEFCPIFSTVFAFMLFAIFLQCGRGGITSRGGRKSYELIPISILISTIFFILATVTLAKLIGGLNYFCSYLERNSESATEKKMYCGDLLYLPWPLEDHVNLYLEYVLSQLGVYVTFAGWVSVLFIQLTRVLIGTDFVLVRIREFGVITETENDGEKMEITSSNEESDDAFQEKEAFLKVDKFSEKKKLS